MVAVLGDGTYLTVLVKPTIRGTRRQQLIDTGRAGLDLKDINTVPEAFDEHGLPLAHLARVIEYDVPDRDGNGTGELVVLLTTVTDPGHARADELAAGYHERWEQETGNDQLKTHLRGPGKVLRSRLPDLVHQEIWAYLIVHPRDHRVDRRRLRRGRPRPGPDIVRQDPAPDPPHRYRDGGHSPLRTGPMNCPST